MCPFGVGGWPVVWPLPHGYALWRMENGLKDKRFEQLTEEQRLFLRMVSDGLTSKEIGLQIDRSFHTINVEIGIAMRLLGARSRFEAASMLAEWEKQGSYERSYNLPGVAVAVASTPSSPIEWIGRKFGGQLPVARKGARTNRMTIGQRLGWILVLAASTAVLLGGMVSGLNIFAEGMARWH